MSTVLSQICLAPSVNPSMRCITLMNEVLSNVHSVQIGTDWIEKKEELIAKLIRRHETGSIIYKTQKSEVIQFKNRQVNDRILQEVRNYFGKSVRLAGGTSFGWAYVTKMTESKKYHNHGNNFSFLSTVFYLVKPEGQSGKIGFIINGKEETYNPREGELLMFPCNLDHSPLEYKGDTYRIALNTQVYTKNRIL